MGKDSKTTTLGAVAGFILAFGGPVLNFLANAPVGFKTRDILSGIAIAVLGKFAADSKKGGQ